eukprot:jgi/Tetstr1/463492/TSEL_008383.t1
MSTISCCFASSEPEALELRQRVAGLLDSLGLQGNSAKGLWEPVRYGQHLGVDIDTATGYFYAPVDKLQRLARQAKQLLQRAARDARWLPVRELQSLAGGLNTFSWQSRPRASTCGSSTTVGSKWGGRVRMTHQLRRDLQWWTAVPTQANGRPIHRPVETAYMHCDSSGYGWVESFLPHLAGRRVLLHEDNQGALNAMPPRYNAAWLDPGCEAVDSLHLSDAEWRRENNYATHPWPLLRTCAHMKLGIHRLRCMIAARPPSNDTERPSPPLGSAGLADSFRKDGSRGEGGGGVAAATATASMHNPARPAFSV